MQTVVALVPACEDHMRPLAGRPLIDYTIFSACEADLFTDVVVTAEPVSDAMSARAEDAFAILPPTSPFRTAATIRGAWNRLLELGGRADSIRAVERCREHPAKIWWIAGDLMRPVLERPEPGTPWHSLPYQALPDVLMENPNLEIAWRHVLDGAPPHVAPFFIEGAEAFSIDTPQDFERAERMVEEGEADLPRALDVPTGADLKSVAGASARLVSGVAPGLEPSARPFG